MITETPAAFARRMKQHIGRPVAQATVKEWADKGQIVMAGDKVNVEASLAQLQATTGKRPDVAARHAEEAAKKKTAEPVSDEAQGEIVAARRLGALADSKLRQIKADMAERESHLQAKKLVWVESAKFSLEHFGATYRNQMENLADRLAPLTCLQPYEVAYAVISEMAESMGREMNEAMIEAMNGLTHE